MVSALQSKQKENRCSNSSTEIYEDESTSSDGSTKCADSSNSDMTTEPPSRSTSGTKVSFLATLVSILGVAVFGFLAGRIYATGSVDGSLALLVHPLLAETLGSSKEEAQCVEEDLNDTRVTLQFNYAEIEEDDETTSKIVDDDEEEDEDDDDEDDDDEVEGVGNLLQLYLNAYGLEDHFADYDGTNGKEIITEFMEDMVEASYDCEEMFPLYGHFAHDTSKHGGKSDTLQALGMFRYGMGQVSLKAWPKEGKIMADFLYIPPRSTEKETYAADEDDEEVSEETLLACVDSLARFFYPDDVIEPSGVVGDSLNVGHVFQLGPFESLSKHGKDPFRFRWWVDNKVRGMKPVDLNDADLLEQMGSSDDWVNRVTSVQSPFQRIDIVDSEDDYETMPWLEYYTSDSEKFSEYRAYMESHPHLFRADRLLYLDGVVQSTLQGLAAYHEALVQPAMFTHPNPKRVAIVGGGECATLRETLKHNTVEKVVMVEIDPVIVEVSKLYLPEWNDCSMFKGSSRYCMDDPRVEMHHLDALKWFRDRFSDEARLEGHELYGTEEKFDVVILDALDPQNAVDFVEALYGDGAFLNSLYNSLTDTGVLLTQVGESAYIGDISETYPDNFNYQRAMYEKGLKNQGFKMVFHYEEPRAGFNGIWSFYAAFKDDSSRARWQMNEAQLDLEIRKRAIQMVDDRDVEEGELKGPFDVFDGPTMATYRFPSKHAQVIYCLRDPQPYGCTTNIEDHHSRRRPIWEPTGFDPEIPNFNADNFALVGSNGKGLVPRVTIPEKSYLMLEQSIHDVRVAPSTSSILERASAKSVLGTTIGPVARFVSGNANGLTMPRRRDIHSAYRVDSGLLSFIKHGCNGNFNTETYHSFSLTEDSADPDVVPTHGLLGRLYSNTVMKEVVFNPSHTRNTIRPEFLMSSRTINEGEEIFSNFVPWYNKAGWKNHISSLRSQCSNNSQE